MSPHWLSEAYIRQHASAKSFSRGEDYYRSGAVLSLSQRGAQLHAEVEGSVYDPYQVRVVFDESSLTSVECDCPYDWGGFCKHIVAVLLAYIHAPDDVMIHPAIPTLVKGLKIEQLQEIIIQLVEQDPQLADTVVILISTQAAAEANNSDAEMTIHQRRNPLDPSIVQRQVSAIIHQLDRLRPSEAYWRVGEVVNQLEEILDQAARFVQAGDGRNALIILDALTDRYIEDWEILDDSNGEASGFFADLGTLWTEALLTADLSAAERKSWASKLAAWQEYLDDYGVDEAFDAAQIAAVQGWDYPPLVHVMRGESIGQETWGDEVSWYVDDVTIARLNVLEREGRLQEYIYLARACGQTDLYLTMLAKLGRIPEVVDYAVKYVATPETVLTVAKALMVQNEIEPALQVAEHGLTLEGYRKAELARWLSDLAKEKSRNNLALNAAGVAFDEDPNLVSYLAVQSLAGGNWSDYRNSMLEHLEKKAYPTCQIEVFLHEKIVEKAINVVDREYYLEYDWIERVVEAAIVKHPGWAIQQSKKQAERIMDAGHSKYYHHAIEWLCHAKAAYLASGGQDEWRDYLESLLVKHSRKYTLVPRLKLLF